MNSIKIISLFERKPYIHQVPSQISFNRCWRRGIGPCGSRERWKRRSTRLQRRHRTPEAACSSRQTVPVEKSPHMCHTHSSTRNPNRLYTKLPYEQTIVDVIITHTIKLKTEFRKTQKSVLQTAMDQCKHNHVGKCLQLQKEIAWCYITDALS